MRIGKQFHNQKIKDIPKSKIKELGILINISVSVNSAHLNLCIIDVVNNQIIEAKSSKYSDSFNIFFIILNL